MTLADAQGFPDIEVDLFVTVGSQVGHFAEMKLYQHQALDQHLLVFAQPAASALLDRLDSVGLPTRAVLRP